MIMVCGRFSYDAVAFEISSRSEHIAEHCVLGIIHLWLVRGESESQKKPPSL
jgi:hypothetical protein